MSKRQEKFSHDAPRKSSAAKEARTQARKARNKAKYAPRPFRAYSVGELEKHATRRLAKLGKKINAVDADRRKMISERIKVLESFFHKGEKRIVFDENTVKQAFPLAHIRK